MIKRLRGSAGKAQRLRRLERTQGLCEHCRAKGIATIATVVDHIVPLAHGGSDNDSNTRNLCRECDRDATAAQFGHRKVVRIGLDGWHEVG
ncbi:HNH endonuclease signature motif containing protein [Sphingomonas sp. 1P06PA]|uniref:HNH endonuclease n=1 Tax=Sphingomonas sp. 1P06PA TaxID=554121 RepID=UPI0039A5025C